DPGVETRISAMITGRKKTTGQLRFCGEELKYKPDRAYFCSPLKLNVLRMDHYCPWLSNCSGYYNQMYFVLFLLHTVASTQISLFSIAQALLTTTFSAGATAFLLRLRLSLP
ncbi:unnamed protein product, partial [Polarella glacialis]